MLFEKATRLKLRFQYKGLCTVEDLWDLAVEELDSIFKNLNARLKAQKEESLLDKKSRDEEILELTVAIVKHIVEVKLREQKEREDRITRTTRKQKVLGIIAEKQDANLRDMPIEDLNKLANEL